MVALDAQRDQNTSRMIFRWTFGTTDAHAASPDVREKNVMFVGTVPLPSSYLLDARNSSNFNVIE